MHNEAIYPAIFVRNKEERVITIVKKMIEWYGWYGMAAILFAYALASFSVIDATGLIFQILNGTGALGIALVSFIKKAYQPCVLNIIWTLIAVVVVARHFS